MLKVAAEARLAADAEAGHEAGNGHNTLKAEVLARRLHPAADHDFESNREHFENGHVHVITSHGETTIGWQVGNNPPESLTVSPDAAHATLVGILRGQFKAE